MKQFIREYFTFNKRERNGVFVLVGIIALELLWLNTSSFFLQPEIPDFSSFDKEVAAFEAAVRDSLPAELSEKAERNLFKFDPNGLSEEKWLELGLSASQVKTIRNYEARGGKFRRKEDLKKMYCISPGEYAVLEPYINLQPLIPKPQPLTRNPQPSTRNPQPSTRNFQPKIIELNTCDSASLTSIKGIGPFYAKSIIKYRNQLGGYIRKEQLMEIWKFDQEKYDLVEKFVTVDPSFIKVININTCKADELKHPYLSWNIARGIVNYREKHGKFTTIEEIRRTDLVDEETLRKIAAYLVIE